MSPALRRLVSTVGLGLLHVAVLGALVSLALSLPPAAFGAGCLLFLAGGSAVLAYRRGVREGERRAKAEAPAPVAPPTPQAQPLPAPAPAPAQAVPSAPAWYPPAKAQPVLTEPYPDTVDLAELGELPDVLSIRMRLVLTLGKATSGIGMERDGCTAVQIAGRWVALDGAGWDLVALAASAREPGGYYLGNCGCGVPDCAGVRESVQVRHEGERITWRVRLPYTGAEDVRTGIERQSRRVTLTFDAAEYRQQAAELVQALRDAAADGGPLVRMNCHPGELPRQVLQWIDEGGAGWGGREEPPAEPD